MIVSVTPPSCGALCLLRETKLILEGSHPTVRGGGAADSKNFLSSSYV